MKSFTYDLHVHSCLSPCADNDNTPNNIAGMAVISGIDILALTDHNTSMNCPAFFKAAERYGIIPIAGMELTTSEDVHAVCLFRTLEAAMSFGELVDSRRFHIKNDPSIFGKQLIVNENDEVCGEEEFLLINAVDMSLDEAYKEVLSRGGVCYPAHIDRSSNGIISMLGDFPPEPEFTAFELNDASSLESCLEKHAVLRERMPAHVASSDAHYLTDISEEGFAIEIADEPYSSNLVRNRLIDYLLGIGGDKNG
jgi:predicted metal-dependent phosphoesterase TrpH